MRMATVVLPVPGLPVKLMCSDGDSDARPCSRRSLSTTSNEATSPTRVFTGARPTSSRSKRSMTVRTPATPSDAATLGVAVTLGVATALGVAATLGVAIPLSTGSLGCIGVQSVFYLPVLELRSFDAKSGFDKRPVYDKA